MPRFPTQQADMIILAEAMISGYIDHPALFPTGDPAKLQSVLDVYKKAAAAQSVALAEAKAATEVKQGAFKRLNTVVRLQIKQSQIDTWENPERLKLIGWSPRGSKLPIDEPE